MSQLKQAGYSGTPLYKKLGFKEGQTIWIKNAPSHYKQLLEGMPEDISLHQEPIDKKYPVIHWFLQRREELTAQWDAVKAKLEVNGSLWISWPKGSSKLEKDLNENDIREIGLLGGLVDVKVCAVDFDWSGLKFMYRTRDR